MDNNSTKETIVQYRQFQIGILAYSHLASTYLADFLLHLPPGFYINKSPSTASHWSLHIVTAESAESSIIRINNNAGDNVRAKLHHSLARLSSGWEGDTLFTLDSLHRNPTVEYVHLILPLDRSVEEERTNFGIHLYQIMRRWLMANHNILLHSSGVVYHGNGYLFLGQSGAGKTTVTKFCPDGAKVLHDDTVFLRAENGGYVLFKNPDLNGIAVDTLEIDNMSGNQIGNCFWGIYLSGIFILKQDELDFLEPVSNLKGAQALITGFLDLPRIGTYTPSRKEFQYAMVNLSKVARETPTYNLHFRRSPEFWKLIDEQFPD